MGRINWGRVFLGGLLAGVVIGLLGAVVWLFLGAEWTAAMEALGRPFPTTGFMALAGFIFLAVGIFAIWLYAAIRPRYGPGPKTAACAGFATWLILSLADTFWGSLGLIPVPLLVTSVAIYLIVIVVATVAGTWPYKE